MTAEPPRVPASRAGPPRRFAWLPTLFFDLVAPLAVYYLLRHFGVRAVVALAAGGGIIALRVVVRTIVRRSLDRVAVLILVPYLVGTILGFATGSPRVMLLKASIITAGTGLYWLGSCFRRPLLFDIGVRFLASAKPRLLAAWELSWTRSPKFRSRLRIAGVAWGLGLILEAAARAYVVLHVTPDTAVIAGHVPAIALLLVLGVATRFWMKGPVARAVAEATAGGESGG